MSIDLGFAPYTMADGRVFGIVDVPGTRTSFATWWQERRRSTCSCWWSQRMTGSCRRQKSTCAS